MGSFKASPSALGASATVTNITVDGDLTLDDGGSIKEAGGTAAITIDGSGHVTKIGQDSPSSGEFLKWDGSKWVADSATSGGGADTGQANSFSETQTVTKDTDGEFVALRLINQSDANNTTGIVSVRFDLEDTGGNAVDSAKIAVKKEAAFTATASTQDSSMVFSTSLNGTLTEQMTLDSAGTLTCDAGVTVGSTVITDDSIVMTPSSGDTATIAAGANGTLTITTVDTAAAAANVGFVVDGAFDIDAAGAVTIDGSAITIGGDTDVAIDIDSSTLDIDASSAVTIDGDGIALGAGSSELDLTTTGTLDVNANALDMDLTDSSSITVTSSTAGEDLTIEQVGANDSSIIITAAGTGTDAIKIDATAGDMLIAPSLADGKTLKLGKNGAVETIIAPHGTAGSELYSVTNTAGTTDGAEGAGAILLEATAGGIGLHAADDKDIWIEGGQAVVTANHDTAGAIKLHADAGSSQTIQIYNDEGTNAAAIDINASAGGITATAQSFLITSATSEKPTLELKNTTASDSNDGPIMSFTKQPSDNAGEADDNVLGGIKFNGLDGGNNSTTYGQFTVHSSDKSSGDEAGEFRFKVMAGGTGGTAALAELLTIGGEDTNASTPCEVIVNEASIDCDFRVESGDETHMLFVDAANNRVSIGDSVDAPAATLEITNHASAGATGVPLLQLNSNDVDKVALDINAANTTANVIDIVADDCLTTGKVLHIDVNDASTSAITPEYIHFDFDKDGVVGDGVTSTFTAFDLDMNDGATNHANATVNMTGIDIDMASTNAQGTLTNTGISVNVSGADTNIAIDVGAGFIRMADDQAIAFGDGVECLIKYDEAGDDQLLIEVGDAGLAVKGTTTGSDAPTLLSLLNAESAVSANDVLGKIQWRAANETGTDAIVVAAAIQATAEADFDADQNETKMEFMLGRSEAADTKMILSSLGDLTILNDLVLFSDDAAIKFGADSDIILTHEADRGLILTQGTETTEEPVFTIKNTGDLASGGGIEFIADNGAGEGDGDVLGYFSFKGDDDGNAATQYAKLSVLSSDVTNNDEGGQFKFEVMANDGGSSNNHALTPALNIIGGLAADAEVVVNDGGVDVSFRVEGDSETHLLFVDAANERISIGDSTDTPAATLEITNHASAGATGVPLLQLNSNDTDKIAVDINAANIDANVLDVTADAVTTANILDVTADGLTTGGILNLVSDSNSNGTRSLVTIHNDNIDGINATLLDLKQDAGASGIYEMFKATGGLNGAAIGLRIKEVAITLNTSGTETTTNNFFPANAIPLALHILVTTQIDDGAKHITKIGTTAMTGLFGNTGGSTLSDGDLEQANDNLTFAINAGNDNFSGNGGITSAQNLVITCNSNPSAGAVRATLFYYQLTVDTSA